MCVFRLHSRYLFHDTWNILDTLTIVLIFAAFTARIVGLGVGWTEKDDEVGCLTVLHELALRTVDSVFTLL